MATLKDFDDGSRNKVDPHGGALVVPMHPRVDPAAGGRYRISFRTGSLAGVTGAAAIAGFRNPSSTTAIVIDRLALRAVNDVDFTTQQLIGLAAYMATAMTAQFNAGGSTLNLGIARAKKRANMSPSQASLYYSSTTTAVSGGTIGAEDSQPLLALLGSVPAAGTTVQNPTHESVFVGGDEGGPIILDQNGAIIIRNLVTLGAAGSLQVQVDISWREIANARVALW